MNKEIQFIIQCYFGDIEDPYLAAIDRAYIDMQTHTVSAGKEQIFEMRYKESEYLYERLKDIQKEDSYDVWHEKTAHGMKRISPPVELSYGQIQKWINMSVKYLYSFKSLGLQTVDDYFVIHKSEFHAPLDSYVLDHLKVSDKWSQIPSYERYKEIEKLITFEDEYTNWPNYAKEILIKTNGYERIADKDSYKRYIQENYSDKGKTYCGKIRWQTRKPIV